jgi:hypothetical protein
MPSLKKLTLSKTPLGFLPLEILSQLTHLTLKFLSPHVQARSYFNGVISMPNLTFLSATGHWIYVKHLDAPSIVTLILHDGGDRIRQSNHDLRQFTVLPQIFHIDSTLDDTQLCLLLTRNGTRLKELHRRYFSEEDTLSDELVNFLIGRACPELERIDVLFPKLTSKSSTDRLRKVVDARSSSGVLRRVRYGLYPTLNRTIVTRHGSYDVKTRDAREYMSTKWWLTEWKELLWL